MIKMTISNVDKVLDSIETFKGKIEKAKSNYVDKWKDNIKKNRNCMIKIKKIHEKAILPVYGTLEAACADLACVEDFTITTGETKVIKTGLKVQYIPNTLKLHVYSRSGLAAKNGIFVLNAPGVIDSDYRGELMVILHNTGSTKSFVAGDRIAQISVEQSLKATFNESDDEITTERGAGGLGSTGLTTASNETVVIDTAEGTIGA